MSCGDIFRAKIPATLARKLGNRLLSLTLERRYEVGIDSFDRMFPNQDTLPKGGFGNLIALPLQAVPRKKRNSLFVDENFVAYLDQWDYLANVKKMKMSDVEKIVSSRLGKINFSIVEQNTPSVYEKVNYPQKLTVISKNGLYIDKKDLPNSLMNKLIQQATFKNPEFFKTQSKRLSTHDIPRFINCSEDLPDYIVLPRGCLLDLKHLLTSCSIDLNSLTKQILDYPYQ
jgi:hypothetical protein